MAYKLSDSFTDRLLNGKQLFKDLAKESDFNLTGGWIAQLNTHRVRFNESTYPDMSGNEDTDNQIKIRLASISCLAFDIEPTLDSEERIKELDSIKRLIQTIKHEKEQIYQKDSHNRVRGFNQTLRQKVIKDINDAYSRLNKILQLEGVLKMQPQDKTKVLGNMGMA